MGVLLQFTLFIIYWMLLCAHGETWVLLNNFVDNDTIRSDHTQPCIRFESRPFTSCAHCTRPFTSRAHCTRPFANVAHFCNSTYVFQEHLQLLIKAISITADRKTTTNPNRAVQSQIIVLIIPAKYVTHIVIQQFTGFDTIIEKELRKRIEKKAELKNREKGRDKEQRKIVSIKLRKIENHAKI